MANENENQDSETQGNEIQDNEISVAIVAGPEYEVSERLAGALEELANAIAEAEGDEVSGFNFTPAMSFNDGMAFDNQPDGIRIRLGCVVNGTGCTCKAGGYSSSLMGGMPTTRGF